MSRINIYCPGEIDEDVYRVIPVPHWNCSGEVEENAFLEWVINALGEFPLPNFMIERYTQSESDYSVRMLQELGDENEYQRAKQALPFLTHKQFRAARFGPMPRRPRLKPGKEPDPAVVSAAADWANLTDLFRRYFGKIQRKRRPTREDILKKKYDLNHDQWDAVLSLVKKSRS